MTDYGVQAALAGDRQFLRRVAACVAALGVDQPLQWADSNAWSLAVTPGWCCAVIDTSGDTAAVTDDMIQEAVTGLLATVPEPPEPEPVPPGDPEDDYTEEIGS